MDKDERFENRQWNDAARGLKKAYNQFSDFEWKVELDEPTRAAHHLRKSLNEFNAAMTHIAKVDVGREQQGAVDDFNKGIKQLDDAVSAIDKGNIDSAETHYDKAAAEFNKAAAMLD